MNGLELILKRRMMFVNLNMIKHTTFEIICYKFSIIVTIDKNRKIEINLVT